MVHDIKNYKKHLEADDLNGFMNKIMADLMEGGIDSYLINLKNEWVERIDELEGRILERARYPSYEKKAGVLNKLYDDVYIKDKEPTETFFLLKTYPVIDLESMQWWVTKSGDLLEIINTYSKDFLEASDKVKIHNSLDLYCRIYETVKDMLKRVSMAVLLRDGKELDESLGWRKSIEILRADEEVGILLNGFSPELRNAKAHDDFRIDEQKKVLILMDKNGEKKEYSVNRLAMELGEFLSTYYALFISSGKLGVKLCDILPEYMNTFSELSIQDNNENMGKDTTEPSDSSGN